MPKIREYPEASQANSNDALILDSEEGTKYIKVSNLLGPLALSSTVDRVTASGSVAHFEDGGDDVPMKDVKVAIEPVQDLHGYDSPWPAGGGKNKLPNNAVTSTSQGVTYTVNNDGTIKANGTSTGWTGLEVAVVTLPAGNYVISSGVASGYADIYLELSGAINVNTNNEGGQKNFTLNESGEITCKLFARPGKVISNVVVSPMIRLATETDSTYTPYSNICPITGWTGAKVTRTGKNLFPQKTISLGKPGGRTVNVYFNQPIKPGTYFFSFEKSGTYTGTGFGIDCFNGNKNVGRVNISTGVLIISEEVTRLYFYYPTDSYDNNETLIFDDIQLELGSTATTYEPYQGDTYSIAFPSEAGTVYGGTLDVTNGVLTVDRAMWIGNTADMNNSEAYPGWRSARILDIMGRGINAGVPRAITNISPAISSGPSAIAVNTTSFSNIGVLWLNKDYFNKNQTEWKAFALDIQVVLPLATPITYTLTQQEITSLLGANNLWADTGDSEVEYRADTKLYIDKKVSELQALILNTEA